MPRPGRVGGDERQVHLGLGDRAQLDLRLLRSLEQTLQRLGILAQVDALLALEGVGEMVDQPAVEVVPTQMAVAGRRPNLDDPVADVEDADVEGAAAEVEHQHGLVAVLVQPVGQRRGGRLVDDPQHLQTGDPTRVSRRGALRVIEVGGHGDDCLGNLLAEVLRGVVGELAQHQRADLLRRVQLVPHREPDGATGTGHHVEGDRLGFFADLVVVPTDEPFGRVDRGLRIEDRLPPRQLTDEPFTTLGERDHRRRGPRTLRVRDDPGFTALPGCDHRVGRTQIDTYCLRHDLLPSGASGTARSQTRPNGPSEPPGLGGPSWLSQPDAVGHTTRYRPNGYHPPSVTPPNPVPDPRASKPRAEIPPRRSTCPTCHIAAAAEKGDPESVTIPSDLQRAATNVRAWAEMPCQGSPSLSSRRGRVRSVQPSGLVRACLNPRRGRSRFAVRTFVSSYVTPWSVVSGLWWDEGGRGVHPPPLRPLPLGGWHRAGGDGGGGCGSSPGRPQPRSQESDRNDPARRLPAERRVRTHGDHRSGGQGRDHRLEDPRASARVRSLRAAARSRWSEGRERR